MSTTQSKAPPRDCRPEIVARFVELIDSHFKGRPRETVDAARRLERLGVTVHLRPLVKGADK
jgi:hypothetical protein